MYAKLLLLYFLSRRKYLVLFLEYILGSPIFTFYLLWIIDMNYNI